MAQQGAAGAAHAGVGLGQEDVPDVRFLMLSKGESRQALIFQITFVEREQIFINLLRSKGFGEDELQIAHQVSTRMNTQRPAIVELNGQASGLFVRMFRKRRLILFLKMMLNAYGSCKAFNPQIPYRYKNAGQIVGDIRALEEGLETLADEVLHLKNRVKVLKGIPVTMPGVLKKPMNLP